MCALPKLLIYGAGGHSKTIIDLLRSLGNYQLVGIVDDGVPAGTQVLGVPVLGGAEQLPHLFAQGVQQAVNAVGGIGNVDVRLRVFERLQTAGFSFPTLIHPSAVIEPTVTLEEGVQVLALSYISSDSHIGFGTLINAGCIVSHDARLGRVVNLSPGVRLAGRVTVEDEAQLGMGVTVNLDLTIGRRARVGNGATVKANVPAGGVVWAGTIWPMRPS